MTGRVRACRPPVEPQTVDVAPARRYDITIGGVHQRTITGDAAETTFRRWSQSPDVVMHGDLRTGFCWVWQNGVRFTIKPVSDRAPRPGLSAAAGGVEAAS